MAARGLTVWLDAPLSVCAERVGAATSRPRWPAGDPQALRALFEKRRAAYALAMHRVDATPPIDAVVGAVALLRERSQPLEPDLR
jgi:shikimate kinase